MNYKYFAFAGHESTLTEAEFIKHNIDYTIENYQDYKVFFIDKNVNCNNFGSVIFSGKVLKTIEDREISINTLFDTIKENIESKIVNVFSSFNTKIDIKEIKQGTKAKSVNIRSNQFPNHGHLKSADNFIISKTKSGEVYLLKITSYTDQNLYKFIDENLPNNDLKKGIINLKLAKSLLNLANNSTYLDPFAGYGRVGFSDLNFTNKFYLSDLDKECKGFIEENLNFLKNKESYLNTTIDTDNFVILDGINFLNLVLKFDDVVKEDKISIVTEGYLGRNFGRKVPMSAVFSEQNRVFKLWDDVFDLLVEKNKFDDIVFCLPFTTFYNQSIENLDKFLLRLVQRNNKIRIVPLLKAKPYILYSRGNSFIGHCIVKIEKKSQILS